jgi:LacI family transcriptional regulator
MPDYGPIGPLSRHLLRDECAVNIRRLVEEKRLWGSYLPSERDLAKLFHVNRGTLRRGLAALEDQGVIVRRRALGNWVLPKPKAGAVRSGGRVVVASLWPSNFDGYVSRIMTGFTVGAGEAGWNVSFLGKVNQPAGREELLTSLRRHELDGLLLFTIVKREVVEEVLGLWSGPAVLVDHHFSGLPLTCVMDDSRQGARAVVEHFLALGHRRIAYVDLPDRSKNPWRFEGYCQALRSAGIAPDGRLVATANITIDAGLKAGRELLARPDPPSAVLAFDDMIALGVKQAAEERGLTVGGNFALAGYGDVAAATGFSAELTSVRTDMQSVGQAAARELGELMAGRSRPGKLVLVPAEVVVRASSRDARPKST